MRHKQKHMHHMNHNNRMLSFFRLHELLYLKNGLCTCPGDPHAGIPRCRTDYRSASSCACTVRTGTERRRLPRSGRRQRRSQCIFVACSLTSMGWTFHPRRHVAVCTTRLCPPPSCTADIAHNHTAAHDDRSASAADGRGDDRRRRRPSACLRRDGSGGATCRASVSRHPVLPGTRNPHTGPPRAATRGSPPGRNGEGNSGTTQPSPAVVHCSHPIRETLRSSSTACGGVPETATTQRRFPRSSACGSRPPRHHRRMQCHRRHHQPGCRPRLGIKLMSGSEVGLCRSPQRCPPAPQLRTNRCRV